MKTLEDLYEHALEAHESWWDAARERLDKKEPLGPVTQSLGAEANTIYKRFLDGWASIIDDRYLVVAMEDYSAFVESNGLQHGIAAFHAWNLERKQRVLRLKAKGGENRGLSDGEY